MAITMDLSNHPFIVAFFKVDVDKNTAASSEAGINCMPTFHFYKNGEKIHTVEGGDLDAIKQAIADHK